MSLIWGFNWGHRAYCLFTALCVAMDTLYTNQLSQLFARLGKEMRAQKKGIFLDLFLNIMEDCASFATLTFSRSWLKK